MCVRVESVFGESLGGMILKELPVAKYKQRQEETNCSGIWMIILLS